MSVTRGRPRAVTIAEARFFLSCGESVEQVARSLGITLDTLASAAWNQKASDVTAAITAHKLAIAEYRRAA